jgi:hypothetical protein
MGPFLLGQKERASGECPLHPISIAERMFPNFGRAFKALEKVRLTLVAGNVENDNVRGDHRVVARNSF